VTDLSPLLPTARAIIESAAAKGLKVVTAESCTGGLVAGVLTEISGSSAVVDRGFVTYSNDAKMEMLGVPKQLIERFGAVSRECALAMVTGALAKSPADIAVSITGIAGPTGGTAEKPVGLVHFASMRRGQPALHVEHTFPNNGRSGIRLASVAEALRLVQALI
jgi:nicotinamide-nucleotide amidase